MTKKQYSLLIKILKMNQEQLRISMYKLLCKFYGENNVVVTRSYVYANGTIPIGLVAHMDTVHKQLPVEIFYDREQDVMWSPQGIGADDRAGVFSILQIIKDGYRPHIILTTDEEIGCIGARLLVKKQRKCPFDNLHFLIELDRRGTDDCVFYELDDEDFEKFIESYGFTSDFGTYSDICEIAPIWDCAAVNLSIGYINEHTLIETLSPKYMFQTIGKVEKILTDAAAGETKHYKFTQMYNYYNKYWGRYYDGYDMDDYRYSIPTSSVYSTDEKMGVCYWCMGAFNSKELISVRTSDGYIDYYCPDCYEKYLQAIGGNEDMEEQNNV